MDVLASLRSLLKSDSVCIDNNIFRLHYKVSVIFLIACSILVTSRQYIGEPISCNQPDAIPAAVINTYCWIHSTFTLPNALSKEVGVEVAHPGIDKYVHFNPNHYPNGIRNGYNYNDGYNGYNKNGYSDGYGYFYDEDRIFHSYYQWVCFMLFFQAALFYIPRYIWKVAEGGKIKSLLQGLDCPVLSEQAKSNKKKLLIEYMVGNLHCHNAYVGMYILCEILNFVNVIGQIYFMNLFLGGQFTTYGAEVIRFTETDQEERVDPMIRVFPRVTKCTFHQYGPSGDVQKHDSLCVLPLNIINEKIYVFFWFWFILMAIISGIGIVYRAMVVVFPNIRQQLLRMRSDLVQKDYVDMVNSKAYLGDWFVLDLLGKNMDGIIFREFIMDLAKRFEGKDMG
ncbi:hypothetical protein CHUAL_009531 [Chamberlinius hualienensis]